MSTNIYLPQSTQELIFGCFHVMFVVSSILSMIGLIFLLTQTPPNQAIIRNYLILIQDIQHRKGEISDAYLEIGFHPIPLFPAIAAYATGVLIKMGLSTLLGVAITVALYGWIGMLIHNCILYRHQTILLEGNALKLKQVSLICFGMRDHTLSQRTFHLIQCCLIVAPTAIPVIFAFSGSDPETMKRCFVLEQLSISYAPHPQGKHNLTWITSRGSYFIERRTPQLNRIFSGVIFFLIVESCAFVGSFVHMFYVLRLDSPKRSTNAARQIRRSLTALFCQLVVPLLLYVLPALTISEPSNVLAASYPLCCPQRNIAHDHASISQGNFVFSEKNTRPTLKFYFYIVFAISSTLNVIGLVFLLKQTPPNQAIILNYLIVIQVLLFVIDAYLEIGYHPFPLFPELAGFATGMACQMGLTVLVAFGITITLYAWIGGMILNCIMYRHQTILLEGNMFKKNHTCACSVSIPRLLKAPSLTLRLIQCVLIVAPSAIPIIFVFSGNDPVTVDRILIENEHNLTWIKYRGAYYIEQRTPLIIRLINGVIFFLSFGSIVFAGIFVHMFHVLRQDSGKRSLQAAQRIRKSLIALFCQLVVPLLLYLLPTITIFLGLRFENLLSFEVCMLMFLLLPLHSIGHNVMLLTITTTYRKTILSGLKKVGRCSFGNWSSPYSTVSCNSNLRYWCSYSDGCICTTWTCEQQWKLRSTTAFQANQIALYAWIGMMIINCILYRHQSMLLKGNKFKLNEVRHIFVPG
ncbi:hypothetical protein PRIPAC_77289 [Pristionchus pacificus]|uniref:G protein-coupled receptor n=1 Tax=Pristionchus pacificus TaxID=54126 RepID=A0A2A6CL80_PRIPA|nr:hypothetical protein PRIPAC_77289 [Pristionchus pacificus]|eukprot:PDM78974.1 G protein-coupled receptor [Pristionchus pacificus]